MPYSSVPYSYIPIAIWYTRAFITLSFVSIPYFMPVYLAKVRLGLGSQASGCLSRWGVRSGGVGWCQWSGLAFVVIITSSSSSSSSSCHLLTLTHDPSSSSSTIYHHLPPLLYHPLGTNPVTRHNNQLLELKISLGWIEWGMAGVGMHLFRKRRRGWWVSRCPAGANTYLV